MESTKYEEDHSTCEALGGCDTCIDGKVLTAAGHELMEVVLRWLPLFAYPDLEINGDQVILKTRPDDVEDSTNEEE